MYGLGDCLPVCPTNAISFIEREALEYNEQAVLENKKKQNCNFPQGCPKLDEGDYSVKLTEIIKNNNIKSLTIVRMEVPCCGGIENAAKQALLNSQKFIPWRVVTISTDGQILE